MSRKTGVQPMPSDLELGKRNVQTASYLFIKNLNDLINTYDSGADTQVAQARLDSIAVQLIKKGNNAINTGIANGAARMLGNNAHGAMGRLVAKAAQSLDLSVVDSAGRNWKDPSKLVQTIVRDFYYQREVEARIKQMKADGAIFFVAGNRGYTLDLFQEVRAQLFHPNSTHLPERFDV
ncbi:hypothetical protein ACNAUY_08135 [Acinetobacter tibetensis]|uniref:hypothetical protein n=1 Tax=Acinetobacter tibetensis TaxID=2943497 RepID=UPI003A4DAB35